MQKPVSTIEEAFRQAVEETPEPYPDPLAVCGPEDLDMPEVFDSGPEPVDQPIADPPLDDVILDKTRKAYYIKETVYPNDPFTKKRERKLVTPAVCLALGCGFDYLEANKYPPWDQCSPQIQALATEKIQQHRRLKHSTADQHIVYEDQIPKEWNGRTKGIGG